MRNIDINPIWDFKYRVLNTFIKKSTMSVCLSVNLFKFSYFRFLTDKPEVHVLQLLKCHKPRVTRVIRFEWGVNHSCRTTSGFYWKWLSGPVIRHYFLTILHVTYPFKHRISRSFTGYISRSLVNPPRNSSFTASNCVAMYWWGSRGRLKWSPGAAELLSKSEKTLRPHHAPLSPLARNSQASRWKVHKQIKF